MAHSEDALRLASHVNKMAIMLKSNLSQRTSTAQKKNQASLSDLVDLGLFAFGRRQYPVRQPVALHGDFCGFGVNLGQIIRCEAGICLAEVFFHPI